MRDSSQKYKYRTFVGQEYHISNDGGIPYKEDAKEAAKRWRRKGYKARVVYLQPIYDGRKEYGRYIIYIRKGR